MFRRLKAVFREILDKEKYSNGQLRHSCAVVQLKSDIEVVKKHKKHGAECASR